MIITYFISIIFWYEIYILNLLQYQSVCKVGTGFKDEDLTRLFEKMKGLVVESKKKPYNYNVGEALTPDDWFQVVVPDL